MTRQQSFTSAPLSLSAPLTYVRLIIRRHVLEQCYAYFYIKAIKPHCQGENTNVIHQSCKSLYWFGDWRKAQTQNLSTSPYRLGMIKHFVIHLYSLIFNSETPKHHSGRSPNWVNHYKFPCSFVFLQVLLWTAILSTGPNLGKWCTASSVMLSWQWRIACLNLDEVI